MRQPGAWARLRQRAQTPQQWPAFEVRDDVAPALELWWGLQTQWRVSDGVPTGMDWASVRASPAVHAVRGRRKREALLADVAVMEHAWLAERARIAAQRKQHRG